MIDGRSLANHAAGQILRFTCLVALAAASLGAGLAAAVIWLF
jgi:hypothetical protein